MTNNDSYVSQDMFSEMVKNREYTTRVVDLTYILIILVREPFF